MLKQVVGIWFYEEAEADKVETLLQRILAAHPSADAQPVQARELKFLLSNMLSLFCATALVSRAAILPCNTHNVDLWFILKIMTGRAWLRMPTVNKALWKGIGAHILLLRAGARAAGAGTGRFTGGSHQQRGRRGRRLLGPARTFPAGRLRSLCYTAGGGRAVPGRGRADAGAATPPGHADQHQRLLSKSPVASSCR